jgi:hypothetical protein
VLVKKAHHVALFVRFVGQRGAPHAVVFVTVAAAEKFGEACDQIGLGEHHIHRREDFELLGQFLHALAQILRQIDRELGFAAGQLGNARRDDNAVDRRLRPEALEQAKEAKPFGAVFFVHGIAAGGVEQNAFSREEPVAIPRAADAVNHCVVLVGERKLQAGIQHGAALARGRVADHDVPGQFIQRRAAGHLTDLRGLDRFHRIHEARTQYVEFGLARGRWGGTGFGLLFGLLLEHFAELVVRAPRAQAAHHPDQQP